MTGNCALHVAVGVVPEPEPEPPPKGMAAGTALSTAAIDRGWPDCIRSLRRSRSLDLAFPLLDSLACPLGLTLAFDVGTGSLYSLGGSQVIAIDVVVRADARGSYGGHTTLGTSPALPELPVPAPVVEPSDEVDPVEVPDAAGTSTHSRGVYRELDCPAIAMIR